MQPRHAPSTTAAAAPACRGRWALALCGALVLAALAPASAQAASVAVQGNQVVFTAAPGELNDPWFRLSRAGPGMSEVEVSERAAVPLSTGSGCALGPPSDASCTLPTTASPLVVRLGDGADGTTTDNFGGGDYVVGSSGHPPATVRVFGEEGNDQLELGTELGTPLRIVADGGPGDDLIFNPRGQGDVLSGGAGSDTVRLVRGLADNERTISLDGQANDHLLGDGDNADNVMPDIEDIDANTGPRGPVHLIGSDADNTLLGGGGTSGDVLEGRAGDDTVMGISGDNRLIGGAGRDSLTGGSGNDLIDARDGERDSVQCGIASADTAQVDELDVVSADCERVVAHLPTVKSKQLKVKKGKVKVAIACPDGGPTCEGKLKLRTAKKVRVGGRRKKLALAKGRYKVDSGTDKKAGAKLTRKGRGVAKRSGKLKVSVELRTAAGTKLSRNAKLAG